MFANRVSRLSSKLIRITLAVIILAVLALSLPQPVSAAATMSFDVIAAKADETVTVRTADFPANVKFTVRMDVAGNLGIDGIVVAETNSGSGGSFEATYRIPAELRGKPTIAIRFESASGWYAYNWFNNRTFGSTSTTPTTTIPVTSGKPYITFGGIKKNEAVMVKGYNFPVNTNMRVRVGPFKTFFRDYVEVTTINTGSTGSFEFTVSLPSVVKDVDMVTVRLDGSGRYAFNAFKNVDTGTVSPIIPSIPTTGSACQITASTPSGTMPKNADFDATWTIKNTSSKTWDLSAVDYRYFSGTRLHKYADRFDLPQTVKPGESIKIIVDMVAPNTAGTYTTNWALVEGKTTLCSFSLTQRVR